MRTIIVLGSTGSIGEQTLEVVAQHPERCRIVGLAAGSNRERVDAQAREFGVEHTALGAAEAEQLVRSVKADVVINGITGSIGLAPTLAADDEALFVGEGKCRPDLESGERGCEPDGARDAVDDDVGLD